MTNTGMISNNTDDHNNADELQAIIDAQAERLRAQDATIKDQERLLAIGHHLGLAYNTIPEHGDAQRLLNGEVPVLTADTAHSTVKTGAIEDDHVLIEGDNLTALTMLQATHKGKVNVIYIDPPYNTGNQDFVYNDRFVDPEDSYRHSKWLSFMRPRLVLARELLTNDGVIFVSIDDHEQAYLRVLMDEVFGEQNFITNLIYDGGLKNNSRFVSVGHDYMLTYAKNKSQIIENNTVWRETKRGLHLFKKFIKELQSRSDTIENKQSELRLWLKTQKMLGTLDKGLLAYNLVDDKGNVFRIGDISSPGNNGAHYDVLHPITHKPVKEPAGGWRYSKSTMEGKIARNEIAFGKDETTVPQVKRILSDDGENDEQVPRSYFWSERSNANKALQSIMGKNVFDFPKDVNVIKRWIGIASPKNAIILDFFAGSGTTGQAVAELNKEDGGHRKCILVTNNFEQDGAENGIARSVTAVRLRRVLTGEDWADGKKHDPLPGNLRYYRIGFKALSDDADVFTGAFTAPGDIAGVIALACGTHDVVSAELLADACPALAAAVTAGRAMVLTNGHGDRVLVYSDAVAVMNGDDEYEDVLSGFHEWAGDKGTVYLASLDDADDDGIVYPLPYVRIVRRTVNGLERQGLLAREK